MRTSNQAPSTQTPPGVNLQNDGPAPAKTGKGKKPQSRVVELSKEKLSRLEGPSTGVVGNRTKAEGLTTKNMAKSVAKSLAKKTKAAPAKSLSASRWPKTYDGLSQMIRKNFPYTAPEGGPHAADQLGAALLNGPTKKFLLLASTAQARDPAPYLPTAELKEQLGMVLRQSLAPALRLLVEAEATKGSAAPFDFAAEVGAPPARPAAEPARSLVSGREIYRSYRAAQRADPAYQAALKESDEWSKIATQAAENKDGSLLELAQEKAGAAYERLLQANEAHAWMKPEGGLPTSNREFERMYERPQDPNARRISPPLSPSQEQRLNKIQHTLDAIQRQKNSYPEDFERGLFRVLENPTDFLRKLRSDRNYSDWKLPHDLARIVDAVDLGRLGTVQISSAPAPNAQVNLMSGTLADLANAILNFHSGSDRASWQTAKPRD